MADVLHVDSAKILVRLGFLPDLNFSFLTMFVIHYYSTMCFLFIQQNILRQAIALYQFLIPVLYYVPGMIFIYFSPPRWECRACFKL